MSYDLHSSTYDNVEHRFCFVFVLAILQTMPSERLYGFCCRSVQPCDKVVSDRRTRNHGAIRICVVHEMNGFVIVLHVSQMSVTAGNSVMRFSMLRSWVSFSTLVAVTLWTTSLGGSLGLDPSTVLTTV